jgi:NADPH:quinone reductase-like Zn-dependent oxidoreductase
MRQIFLKKYGAPSSSFNIIASGDQVPKGDEVRIRVKAVGINFADIMARKGLYPDAPSLPCVLGYEISGIVEAIGSAADPEWLNEEVIAVPKFGAYADKVCVSQKFMLKKPKSLSFYEAATVPVAYLTAWMMLYHMGSLRKGQTVLIQNAGGAVGLAAIDISKHLGACIIGCASYQKWEVLKARGVEHLIDYTAQNTYERVMELTNNRGVDLIIDPIGGESWQENYSMLCSGGRLGVFGTSALTTAEETGLFTKIRSMASLLIKMPRWSPLDLMDSSKGVFGASLAKLHEDPRMVEWLQTILNGCDNGWIKPHIDSVFTFDQVGDAHEYIEHRKNIGKVLLVPTTEDVAEFESLHL